MRIEKLAAYTFPMAFKTVIRHASASRREVENLIVIAQDHGGLTGYGEGCPRQYVTGESTLSGSRFIAEHADSLIAEVHDTASLRTWMDAHHDAIDANPAAFCAMETAVLDLLGKTRHQTVEEILGSTRRQASSSIQRSWPIGHTPCTGGSTADIASAASEISN